MLISSDFWSISLWLVLMSIILVVTAQFALVFDGKASTLLEETKLGRVAFMECSFC